MNTLLLPGKISKKYKVFKAIKKQPRIVEGIIGAGVGSGVGARSAALNEKNKDKKKVGKGAVKGALIGGIGAIGLNQALLQSARGKDFINSKILKDIRKAGRANSGNGGIFSVPAGPAKDNLYELVHKHKVDSGSLVNDLKYWKQKGDKARVANYKNMINRRAKIYRSDLAEAKENFLKQQANVKARQNYIDKFVNVQDPSTYSKYKNSIFGGFKASKDANKNMGNTIQLTNEHSNIVKHLSLERGINSWVDQIFNKSAPKNMGNVHWHEYSELGADARNFKKSPEFKRAFKDVKKGAFKDYKDNTKGDFFGSNFSTASGKNHIEDFKKFNSVLGADIKKIKTKKEFNDIYRTLSKKYHPDINKRPDANKRFAEINDAVSELKKSDWFEKLSGEEYEFEKIAQLNFYTIKQ